jgi:hypothetical protein
MKVGEQRGIELQPGAQPVFMHPPRIEQTAVAEAQACISANE